jgi:hypothetical protein
MELIYCAGGNPRFYQIATDAGFLYGARLPGTTYGPLFFADQEFKAPNRARYMTAVAEHRPHMATVLDWEREEHLPEVLSWAEEIAQWVEVVVMIPKVVGGVERLPRMIGGKPVRLGYSVPTRYAGTELPVWAFADWPVHLLGGSPHAQMKLAHYMDVHSVDGNMMQKMATRWCMSWVPGNAKRYANNRWWPTLKEADGKRWDGDGPYEAFRRSCENIMRAWREIVEVNVDFRVA